MANYAVLKTDKGMDELGDLSRQIADVIDGTVFILPLDSELLIGEMAKEALEALRNKINEVLEG